MQIANLQQFKKFRDGILAGTISPEYVNCDFSNKKNPYPHTFFDLSFHECREFFIILYDLFLSGRCPEYFVFTFDKNQFNIEFAKILNSAFKKGKPPKFLALNFKHCLMGDDSAIELSTMLRSKNTPSHLTLNLENNTISEKAALHFAETIRNGFCKNGFKLILNSNAYLRKNSVLELLESTSHEGCPENFHLSIENGHLFFDIEEASVAKILNSGKCKDGLQLSLGHLLITEDSVKPNSADPSIPKMIKYNKFPKNLDLSFHCSSLCDIQAHPWYVTEYKINLGHAVRNLPDKTRGIKIRCDGEKIENKFESDQQANEYFTTQQKNLLSATHNTYVSAVYQFRAERQQMMDAFYMERDALKLKMITRSLEHAKFEPECPICFEEYLKPGHTRKFLLPCRHMLCKACLEHLYIDSIRNKQPIKCPTCRWPVNSSE